MAKRGSSGTEKRDGSLYQKAAFICPLAANTRLMAKILFDTDIIIDFLRGKNAAKKVMLSIEDEDMPCCSVVTVAEIRAGMREAEQAATMSLLESFDILLIDKKIALLAGDLKRKTKQQQLELDDCFIAATALIHQAVLVTHNTKHYPHRELILKQARY